MTSSEQQNIPGFLLSHFPVFLPVLSALTTSQDAFNETLKANLVHSHVSARQDESGEAAEDPASASNTTAVDAELSQGVTQVTLATSKIEYPDMQDSLEDGSRRPSFMTGLAEYVFRKRNMENKTRTTNGDITNFSTNDALVDLFTEMEDVVSGPRLRELLHHAWLQDPSATLKLIYNARSIHIGKSSRPTFYRALGWLASEHPLTLVSNLQWLVRPIIEKKAAKSDGESGDNAVLVELEKSEDDPTRFHVKDGVAHGYWKDLLNILALAANGKLDVLADPRDILNDETGKKPSKREWDHTTSELKRYGTIAFRHTNVIRLLSESAVYQGLHLTVTRLFAEQLASDLKMLRSTGTKAVRHLSLCGKWAPSSKGFHDKHTFIVSSIAEILHPQDEFTNITDRELYLRHAREAYRKDIAALRKALGIVERDLSSNQLSNIKYDRVPSVAMHNYAGLFAKKDSERFEQYIDQVAAGTKHISGAVLMPAKLIKDARKDGSSITSRIEAKVIDAQWNALVQRIGDSGTLQDSIAVCDVSGSMQSPVFPDGTSPMDSAIGLSLLLAELTKPPFGGAFITFSQSPKLEQISLQASLREKVRGMESSEWGMNTDFATVFEHLILPMARDKQLTQDQMVKRIFVFSDMQFDAANHGSNWASSFERIQGMFDLYNYEMPELVFWNLAGGRGGGVAPKPVLNDQPGAMLVSGYSQAMLKVFLDNGTFETEEEEIVEVDEEGGDAVLVEKTKAKMDALTLVEKAIGHKAFSMLKVVD